MADKIEETIKEIAAKHQIAVGRDDPILILHTINDRLMKDSAAAQKEILRLFQEDLEAVALRWSDDAKNKAERILTAGLNASKAAMATTMEEGINDAVEKIRKTGGGIERQINEALKKARVTSIFNLVAAGMTLLAVSLAVLKII
jgi:hypothetical protein